MCVCVCVCVCACVRAYAHAHVCMSVYNLECMTYVSVCYIMSRSQHTYVLQIFLAIKCC